MSMPAAAANARNMSRHHPLVVRLSVDHDVGVDMISVAVLPNVSVGARVAQRTPPAPQAGQLVGAHFRHPFRQNIEAESG